MLTSIRFLPMLCLNVKLHSSRFCKAIVTFLWSLMLLLSTLADTSNSMSAIVVENVSMDCHILHTTLVDISNSMSAIFVTKISLVSQISDCILVYMIHIRLHGCHSCRKCFNGLLYLTNHIISHISLMLVRNVIRVSSDMNKQMMTHIRERPYVCPQCDQRFTQSPNLKAPIWTHSEEKPYASQQCDKRFTQIFNIKSHMRTHSGEKPNANVMKVLLNLVT